LTEEQWKNQRSVQAAKEVCMDLLLDAVSEKEGLKIHPDEAHQVIEELADQYGIAPEEAEANIDPEALNWKLKRDKALRLILDSAVTDEEGKKELDRRREDLKKDMEKRVEIRNENESS
jgi:FKBP-type peptidyl-prolyl cis-trans isomerase (trigger factor)